MAALLPTTVFALPQTCTDYNTGAVIWTIGGAPIANGFVKGVFWAPNGGGTNTNLGNKMVFLMKYGFHSII